MEKGGSVAMTQIGSVLLSSIKRSAFGLMLEGSLALAKMGITLLFTMKGAALNLMFKGCSLTEIGSALLFLRKRAALALVVISSLSDALKIRCWKKNFPLPVFLKLFQWEEIFLINGSQDKCLLDRNLHASCHCLPPLGLSAVVQSPSLLHGDVVEAVEVQGLLVCVHNRINADCRGHNRTVRNRSATTCHELQQIMNPPQPDRTGVQFYLTLKIKEVRGGRVSTALM